MNNWIEISELRLAHNFHAISEVAGPETTVLAVVKANAYGHGIETCAPMLVRAGARWLGVTSVNEGAEVRAAIGAGDAQILIMSGILPEAVPQIVAERLTPVVWTAEQLGWLAAAEAEIPVHLEVDTGMSRQGVRVGAEFRDLLERLKRYPKLRLDGVFTHFASSEVAGSALTLKQRQAFVEAIATVAASGLRPRWLHVANSSAVDNPDEALQPDWLVSLASSVGARALVRTGLALYGHALPIEGDAAGRLRGRLLPVLTWKTSAIDVRDVLRGETIGYNATFTATRPMRVALLSVGYADGLRRELSGSGWAMLGGQRAAILGRISMNLTSVDATGIAGVAVGDEAVVLGEGITAEDHARLARTIPYEILCGIHPCG